MEISSLVGGLTSQDNTQFLQNGLVNKEVLNNSSLGKDDFLKLLITQLKYQDPTQPLEDKEFISQMAQFSSLEQMTNMSKGFDQVSLSVNKNYALSLLGKKVEINNGEEKISGIVNEVNTMGNAAQVGINGVMYDIQKIGRVVSTQEVQ